jgi:formyl-CoA transferase
VLRASDGSLMVAAANSRLWKQLCTAVGVPHLVDDPRFAANMDRVANRTALAAELERAFAIFTVDALIAKLGECGVPCGRVRTIEEALEDPQVGARQMLIPLEDAELNGFRVIGNPIKLSENPPRLYRRPPRLGEHTTEVLDEIGE